VYVRACVQHEVNTLLTGPAEGESETEESKLKTRSKSTAFMFLKPSR
jgi:hypothetical protein